MKPLKRFFLYCFYCTVAYFTKDHTAHAAYKTWTSINSKNVYSTKSTAGCDSYEVPSYNDIEGGEQNQCGATGASFMAYHPAVLCENLSKDSDRNCTLSSCHWDCEIGCPQKYWGKTVLYSELKSSTCVEDDGPTCRPVGTTFNNLYQSSWCNACPTSDAFADKVCPGGEKFYCTDYDNKESIENYKDNVCQIICSTVPGAYTCNGAEVTDCISGYYEAVNSCIECRPWEICPQGDDNGGVVGCKTGDTGTGTGDGYVYGPYYKYGNGCHACPANATCDQETFEMTCNDGYYRVVSSTTWSGIGALGGEIKREYSTYRCQTCPVGGICSDNVLQSCKDGYYKKPSASECVACAGNAKTCDANGALSCNAGYYWENKQCHSCSSIDNSDCSDGELNCKDGYWLSSDKQCIKCIANAKCDDKGIPTCNDRYAINKDGTECLPCPANGICEQGKFKHCFMSGKTDYDNWHTYYGDITGCYQCPPNAYCVSGLPNGVCMPGYYGDISSSGSICSICPSGTTSRSFTVCSATGDSGCISFGNEISWFKTASEIPNRYVTDCGNFKYESGLGTTSDGTGGSGTDIDVVAARMYTDELGTYYFEDIDRKLGTPWEDPFAYSGYFCPIY